MVTIIVAKHDMIGSSPSTSAPGPNLLKGHQGHEKRISWDIERWLCFMPP